MQATEILEVKQKRRIYDITNVLEGIGLIEKKTKNSIKWLLVYFLTFILFADINIIVSLAPVNPDWFYLPCFTFLVPAHLGSPDKFHGAKKRL